METAGWQFLPSGTQTPSRDSILAAARAGPGPLSRELRAARARFGAARAGALLAAAETDAGQRFGRPFPLLLTTTQQPRSLAPALTLGFAIAGFALEMRSIEGVQDLRAALADDASTTEADNAAVADRAAIFAGVRMSLLSIPEEGDSPERGALLAQLGETLAARTLAPVAVARFRLPGAPDIATGTTSPAIAGTGVTPLDISVQSLFDRRFSGTFGAILTADAADRLADAAAGFAAQLDGSAPKLVITDLDGTLWSGVLGEGGGEPAIVGAAATFAAAVTPHRAYANALAILRARGLVLAVASRNDPADVDAVLATAAPLDPNAFAARAVGWADKPSLVAEILAELGLAPEHAVFIDDDPVNAAAVAARFPAMDVRLFAGDPDRFAGGLLADPLLAGGSGGTERAAQYQRRAAVEQLRDTVADEAAFLRSLQTRLTLLPLDAALLPRAAELASRVNQFLLNGFRPNALQLGARPGDFDVMVRLDDAFGAHGLVGLVLASRKGDDLLLDNLFLSCRALQRGVEGAMLHALAQRAKEAGLRRIVGRVERLPRNEPARDLLQRAGFVEHDERWIADLSLAAGPLAVVPEGLEILGEPS